MLFAFSDINSSLYIGQDRIKIIDNYDSLLVDFCKISNFENLTKSDKQRLLRIYLYLIENGIEACVLDNGIYLYDYKNNDLEDWEEFIRYITINSLLEHRNMFTIYEIKGTIKLVEKIKPMPNKCS